MCPGQLSISSLCQDILDSWKNIDKRMYHWSSVLFGICR